MITPTTFLAGGRRALLIGVATSGASGGIPMKVAASSRRNRCQYATRDRRREGRAILTDLAAGGASENISYTRPVLSRRSRWQYAILSHFLTGNISSSISSMTRTGLRAATMCIIPLQCQPNDATLCYCAMPKPQALSNTSLA